MTVALLVVKRACGNVHIKGGVRCRVGRLAIGCRATGVVTNCSSVVISARLCVARSARQQSFVLYAQTKILKI